MEYGYNRENLSSVMQQWRNVRSRTGMNMLLSGGRVSENRHCINMLTNNKKLAKTAARPGKTQLIDSTFRSTICGTWWICPDMDMPVLPKPPAGNLKK